MWNSILTNFDPDQIICTTLTGVGIVVAGLTIPLWAPFWVIGYYSTR